ncbi:hypothetical protein QQX09_03615 [Demequina sp. SYSU T00192]|uniref:DUF3291 domain-containing protein n=1 Tax=Demequina litoralis TaxID=3051660 RepID=A0ABT8G712_9MICO|nr:hypothetical protein [Demequina sp. SYSU T00192]MDN4474941.1 hypothetical protein [Demequina sp. SYSU T00192]
MIELASFSSTVGLVTGPLQDGLAGRDYRVAAVENGASSHILHVFVENAVLGFCVTWDWSEARCAAYPAPQRAEWWRWAIGPHCLARWRGTDVPADEGSAEAVALLLGRVGELEALARDPGRWQDVRRGRLPW